MNHSAPAYGLWLLVILNSAVFILIMLGFLVQWPTILTLAMFPVLVTMYVRLAIFEEREAEKEFGQVWRDYAAHTPRFLPRFGGAAHGPAAHGHS